MVIGILTVKLHIPHSNSLKSKRMVIKSLKDRLRNRFNVSISEIDCQDKWQLAVIALANISTDKVSIDSLLSKALNFIYDFKEAEVLDHQLQLF
jgi:uncharacterized protein YlxP (DUF503 family)